MISRSHKENEMTKTTIRFAALAAALLFGAATVLPVATPAFAQTTATAPAKPMPKKMKMAKTGNGSATVKSAQDALNKNGASLTVDGKSGPKTKAAIMSFQKDHGLKANGKLDKATKKALGVS
jgi:peptidoglycan hydrolase-like protein with peptidoglycan-binding domain